MSTLTAKRKSDRITMANAVAALAREYGASATIQPEHDREIAVSIEGARGFNVTIEFDGAARDPYVDCFVLSWHAGLQTDACLDDAFRCINPHHFRKATHVANGWANLQAYLRRDLAMLRDGSAFNAEREAASIAKDGTWQQRDAQWAAWRAEEDASRKA